MEQRPGNQFKERSAKRQEIKRKCDERWRGSRDWPTTLDPPEPRVMMTDCIDSRRSESNRGEGGLKEKDWRGEERVWQKNQQKARRLKVEHSRGRVGITMDETPKKFSLLYYLIYGEMLNGRDWLVIGPKLDRLNLEPIHTTHNLAHNRS